MAYTKTRRPQGNHRWGFTTTLSRLTRIGGRPTKVVSGYNEAEVTTFNHIGTWIHYPNTGMCYKMLYDNVQAELERRSLAKTGLEFAIRESISLPKPSYYPPHRPKFDEDLVFTMDHPYEPEDDND